MPANGRPAEANVGLFTFQAPKASAAVWRATQNLGLCLLPSQYCDRLTDVSPSCAFSSSEWPYSVLHLITTFFDRNAPFPPPSCLQRRRSGGVSRKTASGSVSFEAAQQERQASRLSAIFRQRVLSSATSRPSLFILAPLFSAQRTPLWLLLFNKVFCHDFEVS